MFDLTKYAIFQNPNGLSRTFIQIYNNVLWDWQYFAVYSSLSNETWGRFRKTLSVPQNNVMNMNKRVEVKAILSLGEITPPYVS